jgi:hypothetical protein
MLKIAKRRSFQLVLAAVLILSAILCFVRWRPVEPFYQGRPLSQWLIDLDYSGRPADLEARNAVEQIPMTGFESTLFQRWLSSSPTLPPSCLRLLSALIRRMRKREALLRFTRADSEQTLRSREASSSS